MGRGGEVDLYDNQHVRPSEPRSVVAASTRGSRAAFARDRRVRAAGAERPARRADRVRGGAATGRAADAAGPRRPGERRPVSARRTQARRRDHAAGPRGRRHHGGRRVHRVPEPLRRDPGRARRARQRHAGLPVLRRRRFRRERVRAAGRLHRHQLRPDRRDAVRSGTRVGDGARDGTRAAASHRPRPLAREADQPHRAGRDAGRHDRRGEVAQCRWRPRHDGRGSELRDPGPVELRARCGARGRPRRLPDPPGRALRRERDDDVLRTTAAGDARVRDGDTGVPADAPADHRTHRRHPEPRARDAVSPAPRQHRLPAGPRPPARAAGHDGAGPARHPRRVRGPAEDPFVRERGGRALRPRAGAAEAGRRERGRSARPTTCSG